MNEDFDPPNSRFPWVAGYWGWANGGSSGRLAAATAGPVLLVLLIVVFFIFGSSSDEGPETGDSVTVGDGDTATQPPAATLPPGPATPVPPPPGYSVQPGDSLLAICIDKVGHLEPDECVSEIVRLNDLSDPGQIAIDQVLVLPSSAAPEAPSAPEPEEQPAATRRLVLSCDHRDPGVESDIIVRGSGFTPGETVTGQLTGPGLVGDGPFEATAGSDGTFEVRVPIDEFGSYTAAVPGIAPQVTEVGTDCAG